MKPARFVHDTHNLVAASTTIAQRDKSNNLGAGGVSLAGGGDCRSPGGALPTYPAAASWSEANHVSAGRRVPLDAPQLGRFLPELAPLASAGGASF